MISCSMKTGGGEGLGTRLGLFHLHFTISCSIKTGGGEGLGTRLGLFRLRLTISRSIKAGVGEGLENKAGPSQPPAYDLLQYENWRRGRPGNKAWRQGYSIQHSLVQYTIIGFRATAQTLTGEIHCPHTEEDSKGNS